MFDRKILTLTSLYQLATLLASVLVCWFMWREAVVGMIFGGLLMATNFYGLHSLATRAFTAERGRAVYGVALALKLGVVLALMAVCLVVFKIHALGFTLGMATLFVGIALAGTH